eukprot:1159639-Pelagomonas_calceolata.AAC.6
MLGKSPGKSVGQLGRQQQQGAAAASPKLVSQPASPARKQAPAARKQLLKEEQGGSGNKSPVQVNAVASLTVAEPAQEPAVLLPPAPESIVELTPATYQVREKGPNGSRRQESAQGDQCPFSVAPFPPPAQTRGEHYSPCCLKQPVADGAHAL